MKIGIDARLWSQTGVGRYIRNLVSVLHKIDSSNEYVLFCLTSDVSSIKHKVSSSKWKLTPSDIRWHTIKEQFKFLQIINKENLDLMHFTYFSVPLFYNRPFIVTIHDLIVYHFQTGKASSLPLPLYKVKHLGYKLVLSKIVKKSQVIIVPLNSTKMDLLNTLKITEDKVVVTYEGVDSSLLGNENQKEMFKDVRKNSELSNLNSKFFLYVGNAYPHKNLDTLIKAFIKVISREHKISSINSRKPQLVLVGKSDYFYKQLEYKINKEHIEDVKIIHDINDRSLTELYKNALAVIAPSIIEGFGLVPLEAMANGSLILASDIPAHREVCRDIPIYFNPYAVDDLVDKLQKVIDGKIIKTNHKLIKGSQRAKEFSWERMVRATLNIYERFEK